MWFLDQIFGPNAAGNPYYELYADAFALIPWWYPILIASITAILLFTRWYGRFQYRRHTVLAAARIRNRTVRLQR